jgi:putative toxin-antitoxin system antitoxin component (TIGR02293 family)
MGGKLGVAGIRFDRDLASLVTRRSPAAAIKSLVRAGLSDAEVYQLIVPARTLADRIANHQLLCREESDKRVRVARIAAMAERAFRGADKAWRWLPQPKRRLEAKTTLEIVATEAGARLVEEMILQFEYGITA